MKFRKKIGYLTKKNPYDHQYEQFKDHRTATFWAYLWDMGTGKTKMAIDIAVYWFLKKTIKCVVIIAPNDVHVDHLEIALPDHIYPKVNYKTFCYHANIFNNKKTQKQLVEVLKPSDKLVFAAFNTDAVRTKKGFDCIKKFLTTYPCYMVIDEYTDFINPRTTRAKQLMKLYNYPIITAIMDGTPIHKDPIDLWVGFNWLQVGCLGFTSFTAFKNRYCQLENFKLRSDIYMILPRCLAIWSMV